MEEEEEEDEESNVIDKTGKKVRRVLSKRPKKEKKMRRARALTHMANDGTGNNNRSSMFVRSSSGMTSGRSSVMASYGQRSR